MSKYQRLTNNEFDERKNLSIVLLFYWAIDYEQGAHSINRIDPIDIFEMKQKRTSSVPPPTLLQFKSKPFDIRRDDRFHILCTLTLPVDINAKLSTDENTS